MSRASGRRADDEVAAELARRVLRGPVADRVEAADELCRRTVDLHDIRVAQPALGIALLDPDVQVRRAASQATAERVLAASCDVRAAFPALLIAVRDVDPEVRSNAWWTLKLADRRHDVAKQAFREAAQAAVHDPEPAVRQVAAAVLAALDHGR